MFNKQAEMLNIFDSEHFHSEVLCGKPRMDCGMFGLQPLIPCFFEKPESKASSPKHCA